MFPKIRFAHTVLSIILVLISTFFVTPSIMSVQAQGVAPTTLPTSEQFVASVSDGRTGVVRGVYVPNILAFRVLQQPSNNPGYVSPVTGIITEFELAKSYGNIGLLAHNYLAGADFSKLSPGQEIYIVYGNGFIERFVVKEVLKFQALEPTSPTSDFVNLDTDKKVSTSALFQQVYKGQRHVTFQTCIYADRDINWGRLFVIAMPMTDMPKNNNKYDGTL